MLSKKNPTINLHILANVISFLPAAMGKNPEVITDPPPSLPTPISEYLMDLM
jgi:hypothetical protein